MFDPSRDDFDEVNHRWLCPRGAERRPSGPVAIYLLTWPSTVLKPYERVRLAVAVARCLSGVAGAALEERCMDFGRRRFVGTLGAVVSQAAAPGTRPRSAFPRDTDGGHERFMRLAMEQARQNPAFPFGAVIVGTRTGEVLAGGVNATKDNPALHGEVVAMNDYVRRHGNHGWADTTLYTTGEPCSMCVSAMVWANLRRVVWGSSIDEIRRTGIHQIALSAREVARSAGSFYTPELFLGGVLADSTDRLFQEARRLRRRDACGELA
ncbi:tRNA(Arg) A34 adenosine deaminase TadA [Streptomyces griseochromogenes]|uniref:tRNA(Arg) A34 adenosine deaminase TadA n=2 Tax=Streptomyces griseochromogenes TaxID=68214 RepID=A0ABS4LJZ2_9ACTN|nr:nucleoside deaminase [Streptomyces griseochromogenes]MBP2047614.1 tRNA(Arg) A34 adenosine deaminase TadA [Streptomyces griseochromogenes]